MSCLTKAVFEFPAEYASEKKIKNRSMFDEDKQEHGVPLFDSRLAITCINAL